MRNVDYMIKDVSGKTCLADSNHEGTKILIWREYQLRQLFEYAYTVDIIIQGKQFTEANIFAGIIFLMYAFIY